MAIELTIVDSEEQVADAAVEEVRGVLARRRAAAIAVPTGRTPMPMYERLVQLHRDKRLDLSSVRWFALDEFLGLPPTHPGSFRHWLERHLIGPARLDPLQLWSLRGDAEDPAAEALSYEARIRSAGGLDLALLGIGTNGHLAFNEPGTTGSSRTGVRRLTAETRAANRYLFPNGEVPREGLTIGLGTLLESRVLVVLATGGAKAAAVEEMLRPPPDALRSPASLLQGHPHARAILDRPAAAHCRRSP